MPPAKFLRAFAKDDVRLRVLLIPDDIVLVLVSPWGALGRGTFGDEGRVVEIGEDVREDRRERAPACARRGGGGWWKELDSSRVNGDSRRSAMM